MINKKPHKFDLDLQKLDSIEILLSEAKTSITGRITTAVVKEFALSARYQSVTCSLYPGFEKICGFG